MNETHTDVNKMLENLKRTLDDLSGNEFKKVRNKFGDLSGNNLKYSSPNYDKGYNKEKFTDDHAIIAEITTPIKTVLTDVIQNLGENVVGETIKTIITPVVSIIMNMIIFTDTGQAQRAAGEDPNITIFSCYDNNGKCQCSNNCNLNKGVIGKLILALTGMNIMRDDKDNDGIIDYYAKGTLMIAAILIASIIWKAVTFIKKITLFMLGHPK